MAIATQIPAVLGNVTGQATVLEAKAWVLNNSSWLKTVIEAHDKWLKDAEVDKYQVAYDGYLEKIDQREKARGDDTNNKLYPNYAAIIIDTVVDYLLGQMFNLVVEDPGQKATDKKEPEYITEYRKELKALLMTDKGYRVLMEWLRQGSIAGYSVVISWVDEKGKIDFEEFPAQECIPITDVRGRLVMLIRRYQIEIPAANGETETRIRAEVYDDRYITYYISDKNGESFELDEMEVDDWGQGNPVEHKAGRLTIATFLNGAPAKYEDRLKKAGRSDLANGVFSLLEAYAAALSDKANLSDYLQDQFLLLIGVDTNEKEVLQMRKARALQLKGGKNESDARFIAQDQADGAVEHFLDRLEKAIYDTTFTPKLSDISGTTATEVKLKYAGLDIKAGKKETYFLEAFRQLIEILTDFINCRRLIEANIEDTYSILTGQQKPPLNFIMYNADWVTIKLNRNLPQNYKELADIVAELAGKVPDKYLLSLLWFVEDPQKALDELKAQKIEEAKANIAAMGYGDTGLGNLGSVEE